MAGSSAARAQSLDEATSVLATQIAKYLNSKNKSEVFIGAINGPSNTSTGPTITKALKDKLGEIGSITVSKSTGWQITGQFLRVERDNGSTIIGLIVRLLDENGIRQTGFRGNFNEKVGEQVAEEGEVGETITDKEDVANLSGVSSVDTVTEEDESPEETADNTDDTPADEDSSGDAAEEGDTAEVAEPVDQEPASEVERGQQITEKINNPTIFVNEKGFVASPFDGSPYRMEILVLKKGANGEPVIGQDGKPVYEPRFMNVDKGFAFTDLFEGDIYAVRIYNFSEYDAGVKLTIDGINSFEFSTVEPFRKLGMWVVPRAVNGKPGTVLITGWHHSVGGQNAESFLVTSADKGVAAQLGRNSTAIGTITAMFFAAWRPDEPKPPIEIQQKRSGRGTDRGPLVAQRHTVVHRFFGKSLLAAVSVRYNKPGDDEIAEDLPQESGPQDSVSQESVPEETGT